MTPGDYNTPRRKFTLGAEVLSWALLLASLQCACHGSSVLYNPRMEGIQADAPPGVDTQLGGSRSGPPPPPAAYEQPPGEPNPKFTPDDRPPARQTKPFLSSGYAVGSPGSEYEKPPRPAAPKPRIALQNTGAGDLSGRPPAPYGNNPPYKNQPQQSPAYPPPGAKNPFVNQSPQGQGYPQDSNRIPNPKQPLPAPQSQGQNRISSDVNQPTYPVPGRPTQNGISPSSPNNNANSYPPPSDSQLPPLPPPIPGTAGKDLNSPRKDSQDSFPGGFPFPFPSPISFESPRPFKSRTPPVFSSRDALLPGFNAPVDAKMTRNQDSRTPASQNQPAYQSQPANTVPAGSYPAPNTIPAASYPSTNTVPATNFAPANTVPATNNYRSTNNLPVATNNYAPVNSYPVAQYASAPANNGQTYFAPPAGPGAFPNQRFTNVGGPPTLFGYNNPSVNNRAPVAVSGQCFQYTYAAEAYRLSDIAKSYPQDAIQKELNQKPYLAPLVGMQVSKESDADSNPFSRFSNFDFGNFGFEKKESPAEKYSYLLNSKAYPGNYKDGDFSNGYPTSMKPLDTSCPSQQYKLRSFFYHGGDCYVVNPEFQQVIYHRCSRRECNFCGVNRGLSACVEDYRWFTVFSYCSKLPENSRIVPLRLILPVGCTCQHFPC